MRTLLLLVASLGIARAEERSCSLDSDSWTAAVSLSAAAGATPWAKLRGWGRGPRATVALGDVVGVSLSGDGLELRAVVEAGPWLHPRKPLRFGRTVIAGPGANLTLHDAATLLVEATPPSEYRPAQPLRTNVACDALSLDAGKTKGLRAATGLPAKLRSSPLRDGVDIPISAEPAGAPEGTLLAADDRADVEIVKQSKGWTLIVADLWSVLVYGWIPSGFVQKRPAQNGLLGGVMGGLGGLGLSGVGGPAPPLKRCAVALRVWTRQRGRTPAEVGLLRASTPFYARASDPMWTAITLPDLSWLELLAGNELVVAAGDLERCETPSLDR